MFNPHQQTTQNYPLLVKKDILWLHKYREKQPWWKTCHYIFCNPLSLNRASGFHHLIFPGAKNTIAASLTESNCTGFIVMTQKITFNDHHLKAIGNLIFWFKNKNVKRQLLYGNKAINLVLRVKVCLLDFISHGTFLKISCISHACYHFDTIMPNT